MEYRLVVEKFKTWCKIIIILFVSPFLFSQPYSISNLVATSGLANLQEGSIKFTWTYPGPDVLPEGSKYYIQYSTFTEISWSTSNAQVVISTGPVNVEEEQTYIITNLDAFVKNNSLSKDTTFYFVIWTSSGTEGLLSEISNIATGWITLIPPSAPYFYLDQCLPGGYEGSINLTWSGSGDDDNNDVLNGNWYIQYSTYETFNDWNYNNYSLKISTQDVPSWLVKSYLITGLTPGITYYFRLWAEDDLGNVSDISDGATTYAQVDISPPRPVTCIKVSYGFRHVNLEWIVPQEDSYFDGFLYNPSSYTGCYEIRWRNEQPILNNNLWNTATSYGIFGMYELWPLSSTTIVVTGLTNFTSYYFAIKVADERFNWPQIGPLTIGGVVFESSSPVCQPINSPPQAVNPQNHFVYDPVLNSTATVISSTTVKIDWSLASWHAGCSYTSDETYGDYISSYTVRIATYTVGFSLGIPTITFSGINLTSVTVYNLNEDTTYYWDLTCYDSESLSSTTVVFKFVINSTNSAPVFPTNPLLSPTTVWHTKEYKITFSWEPATDPDPFDFVIGYRIYISSNSSDWYPIPLQGYIVTNSTTVITQDLYCYSLFSDAENNKIYWYVIAYDSGAPFGYPQLSTQTPTGVFWLNQRDEPPNEFEVYFPSGTRVLVGNATYYKVIIDGTTYYPIMEKIVNGTTYYIVKSTPIILAWQPTSDPDPEDGIIEYAIFISSSPTPELTSSNGWRYIFNPINDSAPYESNYWFYQWDFFTSTSITKMVEEGTMEGNDLVLLENTSYYWRARARDSYQTSCWIWDSTQTFSPSQDRPAAMFIIDFTSEPPSGYGVVTPTGVINPQSLEGPIYFDWTDAVDPDPFDSLKYYFISVSTVCPQDTDGWFTLPAPLWKINTWLSENPVSSATLMFTNPQLTPGTTYFWQVHSWGKQEWDYAVAPSTSQPYRVKPYGIAITTGVFIISNQKPYKFNLVSPGTATTAGVVYIKTYRPTFYWEQVYDPDNYDPVVSSYVVVISSHPDFSFTYQIFTSTTYLVLDFDLQSRTTYYWCVKAYDKFGNFELPYSTFYFKIENFEPNMFDLVYPTSDTVVPTLTPTFQFQNKSDPDGDVVYYTIQYSSYPDFSVYESSSEWSNAGVGTTMYILSPWEFEENKQYFWRIVADDKFGGVTTSTVSSFWVNSVEELPNSFDVNITSGVITQKNINFSWNPTDDPDPKDYVVYYKLCISSVPNYVVGVSTYVVIYGSTTTNYTFDVSYLTENAVYCWWVEAYDKTGLYRKSSSSYTFIVDLSLEPPDDVYLLWPGSSTDFVRVSSQVVTFVWTAGNKTEWWKSIDYTLYISSSDNVYTFSITSGPYTNWYNADKIYFSTGPLIENTTYFWRVEVLNSLGVKTSSTFYFFYDLRNDPPYSFELLTPSGTVNTRLPDFTWQPTSDPDDTVSHYVFKYSSFSTFAVYFSTSILHSLTKFTPTTKLNTKTTYYWKVEVYDTRGGINKSDTWQFYIPELKPYPIVLTSISPQGVINTRKPKLSWSPPLHMDIKGNIVKYKLILTDINGNVVLSTETSDTEFEIQQNLIQNLTYYLTVVAVDDDDVESEPQNVSFFVSAVNIPQRVKVKSFDIEKYLLQPWLKITIRWDEVRTYTDGTLADDIAGYNIYRSTFVSEQKLYKFVPSTVTVFTEDVLAATTYYYNIKTVTIGGIESAPLEEILSTIYGGSKLVLTTEYNLVLPKEVCYDMENKGMVISVTTQTVAEFEFKNLNVIKKYEIKVLKDGVAQQYKFLQPIVLEINKEPLYQSLKFTPFNFYDEDKLSPVMFYFNGIEYIFVNTECYPESIVSKISQPGLYSIRLASLPTDVEVVQIYPRKIFTPTSSKDNKIHFVIYNPTMYQPEGEVYDTDLRFVAKLKYENGELVWDGKYENGKFVPKGVYIYKIKVGNRVYTGSIIVAK